MAASKSATLVLINAPEDLYIGIDYTFWKANSKFRGVRDIPFGVHYLSWQPPDEDEQNTLGRFLYFDDNNKICTLTWNSDQDGFGTVEDYDEEYRYIHAVESMELQPYLAVFNQSCYEEWKEICRYITKDTIDRIEPVQKFVQPSTKEYDISDKEIAKKVIKEQNKVDELLESFDEKSFVNSNTLFLLKFPNVGLHQYDASEITKQSTDYTSILTDIIEKQFKGDCNEFLGELQFAYICFLLGKNYEGFQQWTKLIQLLSNCEEAVDLYPKLYENLLRALHGQLSQFPEDFFEDTLTKDNFFIHCLLFIIELCKDSKYSIKMANRVKYLETLLQSKFKMTTNELALLLEDAPVVVDTE